MGLKCFFVTKRLASLTQSDEQPTWISNHIENCRHCKSEAKKYAAIRAALRTQNAKYEPCSIAWVEIEKRLVEFPAEPRRNRLVPALSAAACVCILAVMVWMISSRPANQSKPIVATTSGVKKHTVDIKHPMKDENHEQTAQLPVINNKPMHSIEPIVVHPSKRIVKHRHQRNFDRKNTISEPKELINIDQPEDKEVQIASIPPEVSYQAGRLIGQKIAEVAANAGKTDQSDNSDTQTATPSDIGYEAGKMTGNAIKTTTENVNSAKPELEKKIRQLLKTAAAI